MPGQRAKVFRPLPQRGEFDDTGVQILEQIVAEAAIGCLPCQVAAGSGNQPEITGLSRVAAALAGVTLVQRLPQPLLQGERQLADLVEEQGAVLSLADQPRWGGSADGLGSQLPAAEL